MRLASPPLAPGAWGSELSSPDDAISLDNHPKSVRDFQSFSYPIWLPRRFDSTRKINRAASAAASNPIRLFQPADSRFGCMCLKHHKKIDQTSDCCTDSSHIGESRARFDGAC